MLRSKRLFVIALGGWLSASALAQTPDTHGTPKPSPAAKSQGAAQPGPIPYPTEDAPLPIRIIEKPDDVERTQARDAKTEVHDAADLIEQRRAADAVQQQVTPTYVAAWLSGIGTILLIATLGIAEADRRHTKRSSEAQLRAYIGSIVIARESTMRGFDWDDYGRFLGPQVGRRNFGQTPARNVRGSVQARVFTKEEAKSQTWALDPALMNDLSLSPGELTTNQIIISDPNGPIEQAVCECKRRGVAAETHEIWVWGRIDYDDIFGKSHETHFRYFIDKLGFRHGQMFPAREGNSAT
jgi:hypothetical protein